MTTLTMTGIASILGGMLATLAALLGGRSRTAAFRLDDGEVLEQLAYGRD